MSQFFYSFTTALLIGATAFFPLTPNAARYDRGAAWEHDAGPDVSTDVGYRYAELFAQTPNYREIGRLVLGKGKWGKAGEKFRWRFGPMFRRGRLGKNEVKVLVIGQEGAQDENISDQSFTGGTGGRMQKMLDAMGINKSYLFLNTFIYTIKGQYADFAPQIQVKNGRESIRWANLITNEMYKLSQIPGSPLVDHRHDILDHAIESNKDSLKLIIAVGGAAQDTLATYIESKGGDCPAYNQNPKNFQAIRYGRVGAGGNRSFFFPVDENGRNLLLKDGESNKQFDFSDNNVQKMFKKRASAPWVLKKVVRLADGELGNGINTMKQLGKNLYGCKVRGKSFTLKGLKGIKQDIRFIKVKHPGSNSPQLEKIFKDELERVAQWNRSRGWSLPADRGAKQPFDKDYRYGHKAVPRWDFRFGLPDVIGMGTTNSTRRHGGRAIEFGSRDRGSYTPKRQSDAYRPTGNFMYNDVPWEPNKIDFTEFDFGPGEKWGKIFTGYEKGVASLPSTQLRKANPTAHPKFGASAIYRGRPENAEVLVLADQHSHDDMWVGRALMGYEGQKLQAFLEGLRIDGRYLILRTLPVDTLGANSQTVSKLLEISSDWRQSLWDRVLMENRKSAKLILTLGEVADKEIQKMSTRELPVISLTQSYSDAFEQVKELDLFRRPKFNDRPIPIARADIPYGMRRWVGTSGDRVQRANGQWSGRLYKIWAPNWATSQRPRKLDDWEKDGLLSLDLPDWIESLILASDSDE